MKNHHEEIIYRALRGQATQEEEEMIARWYKESPEECSREIEAIHSIIDLTGMAGIMTDKSSAHGHAHKIPAGVAATATTTTAATTAAAANAAPANVTHTYAKAAKTSAGTIAETETANATEVAQATTTANATETANAAATIATEASAATEGTKVPTQTPTEVKTKTKAQAEVKTKAQATTETKTEPPKAAGITAETGSKKEKAGRRRTVWIAAISSAAAVALAIVTGYISHELTYDSISSLMTAVEAPPGEHFIITLPDSSSVHLNSGARIEYPVVFRKDKREVYLTGEAMFDVVHDESRPFVVRTFISEVSVLGTKFDVEAYKESSIFTTTLLEGRVKVVNLSDPERKGIILNPNDMLRIENGIMKMEKISGQDDICWTRGLIKIGGKTFDRTMEDFEKAFGVNIEIEMKRLPDISEVSGKIRVNDGVANALRILQRTADFKFRINEATDTVTIY